MLESQRATSTPFSKIWQIQHCIYCFRNAVSVPQFTGQRINAFVAVNFLTANRSYRMSYTKNSTASNKSLNNDKFLTHLLDIFTVTIWQNICEPSTCMRWPSFSCKLNTFPPKPVDRGHSSREPNIENVNKILNIKYWQYMPASLNLHINYPVNTTVSSSTFIPVVPINSYNLVVQTSQSSSHPFTRYKTCVSRKTSNDWKCDR